MSEYYNAVVCTNGHVLSRYHEPGEKVDNFCQQCGGKTILSCSNCGTAIRGHAVDGIITLSAKPPKPPAYCPVCGNPYPWTEKASLALIQTLREEDELETKVIDNIERSLPDVISETPATGLAAARFRKALLAVGTFTAEAAKDFIVNFGCEAIKNILGV